MTHPRVHRLAAVISCILWSGCSRCETADDEAAILSLVAQGVQLAEASNAKGLMSLATDDFERLPEGHSAETVRQQLTFFFRQSGAVAIHYPRPTVSIDRETRAFAEVHMPFALVRKGASFPDVNSLVDDPAAWIAQASTVTDIYSLELWLVKKDGQWRVRKARMKRSFR